MRTVLPVVLAALVLLGGVVLAPQASAQEQKPSPGEAARQQVGRVAAEAAGKIKDFAAYADGYFKHAAASPAAGWFFAAVAALSGALALFFGWALLQSLMVPCAPVLGLATGGFLAFCIVEALYTNRPVWFRLTLLAVGAVLGVALYLFSALKARPVAAFLVIMSPFLILAAFLFSYNGMVGLVIFTLGFVAGFAAMIEARPLSIVATSMFGSLALLGALGLLSHLLQQQVPAVRNVFTWLIAGPLTVGVAWAVMAFAGCSFQFTTGPRGTLKP